MQRILRFFQQNGRIAVRAEPEEKPLSTDNSNDIRMESSVEEKGESGLDTNPAGDFRFVSELKSSVEEIAAVVEELSANTQETASATQAINSAIKDVNTFISSMAGSLVENIGYVTEISSRAASMKNEAVSSGKTAGEMCGRFEEILSATVDKVKDIGEIDTLVKNVLHVASRINLISLNATIEAARAGEHGRGFTVVASEIKKLADQTKSTVLVIQEIADKINAALANLVSGAKTISDFMENRVTKDYSRFVQIGEQYDNDASNIYNMMENYANTVDSLTLSIRRISSQVSAIAAASEENARGTNEIAINLMNLSEKSAGVISNITN